MEGRILLKLNDETLWDRISSLNDKTSAVVFVTHRFIHSDVYNDMGIKTTA